MILLAALFALSLRLGLTSVTRLIFFVRSFRTSSSHLGSKATKHARQGKESHPQTPVGKVEVDEGVSVHSLIIAVVSAFPGSEPVIGRMQMSESWPLESQCFIVAIQFFHFMIVRYSISHTRLKPDWIHASP